MSKASANYFDVMRSDQIASSNQPKSKVHLADEWDRMMAEHVRDISAIAWDEGMHAGRRSILQLGSGHHVNPYRETALNTKATTRE